eukprot:s753_g19.t2
MALWRLHVAQRRDAIRCLAALTSLTAACWSFSLCGDLRRGQRCASQLCSFYGDSIPMPPPGHPDHPVGAEVQPFANQNGGIDDTLGPPKIYMYGPAASPLGRSYAVDCNLWHSADTMERQQLVDRVLETLRRNGFVVLENMVPPEEQFSMEAAAIRHFEQLPEGYFTSPLRADRSQVHVPYEDPWSAEWLVPNDLVLQVTARYVINNMACGRSEEEQQSAWCQWVMQGSSVEWFHSVPPQDGPLATDPPHGCTNDIILPGPFAQLTIGVPLTPLSANNGPLALRPGSHVMNSPGYEVVTNIPHGSIMLYDSFVDHRAVEHRGQQDRFVLYYEFETRGIFTGYVDGHFGQQATQSEHDFRQVVDPILRRYVAKAQCAAASA